MKKTYSLLGLFKDEPAKFVAYYEQKQAKAQGEVSGEVLELVERREQAKAEKNWALADEIRAKITELGYCVKDTKDGATVEKLQ